MNCKLLLQSELTQLEAEKVFLILNLQHSSHLTAQGETIGETGVVPVSTD
jgi:hypothetical protein